MKTLFKKENLKTTIFTIVYLIIGAMLCISPLKMFNFIESALCFVMLIAGIVCIFIYSVMSSEDKIGKLLLYGIVGMVLGIVTILFPKVFAIILSLIVCYTGIGLIISSAKDKKLAMSWVPDLVVGIIVTVLSIVSIILVGTSVAKRILAIFFGIILLINGIYCITSLVKIVKMSKKQSSLYEGESGEKEVDETKEETDQDQTVDIEEVQIQKESENKSEFVEEELKQEKKKVKNSIRKNYRKAKKKS